MFLKRSVSSRCLRNSLSGVLSRAVISHKLANSSENIMRNRVPPLQNSKTRTQNGRRSRHFWCPFFTVLEGWDAFSHSLSRGFCKGIANYFRRQQNNCPKRSPDVPPTTHARSASPLPFFWTYFRPDWPKISAKKWKRRPLINAKIGA